MPEKNRIASYALNNISWGDPFIASLGGSRASANFFDNAVSVSEAMTQLPERLRPEIDINFHPEQGDTEEAFIKRAILAGYSESDAYSLFDKELARLKIASNDIAATPSGFASWLGIDPSLAGKYIAFAVLALILVAVGIVALVGPSNILKAGEA